MDILEEAQKAVNNGGDSYDKPERNLARIATLWEARFKATGRDIEITAGDVAAMMILFKVVRQDFQHKRDNLVDIAGYAKCWDDIEQKTTP